MDYFNDVYLKRVNQYGTNIQDRIQGKMEYGFNNIVKKSPNKVDITINGLSAVGVLETVSTSEKEVIDYLLTYKTNKWNNGSIFYTKVRGTSEYLRWMILSLDKYQTIGYNRYKVILLDSEISWIGKDNLLYKEYAHFTGTGSSRDKAISSNFKIQFSAIAVNLPNKSLMITMPYNSALKKGCRLRISEDIWKVSGFDKESVAGVAYVTLEEDYIDAVDDATVADINKLSGWNFMSNMGDSLNLVSGDNNIEFYSYYNGLISNEPIGISFTDERLSAISNGNNTFKITCAEGLVDLTTLTCSAYLVKSPEIKQAFSITVTAVEEEWLALIVGSDTIKVGQSIVYELKTNFSTEVSVNIYPGNIDKGLVPCFEITEIGDSYIKVRGITIGNDTLKVSIADSSYEKDIKIVSMWM